MVLVDNQTLLDALLLKVVRFSNLLLKNGWSPEDVSDVFGFSFRAEKERRPATKLSPKLIGKFEELADSVNRS